MYVSTHLYNMYEASPPSRPLRQRDFSLFPFSLKENVTPILHSSFFILHSSFKKSPSVGRVTARYLVDILLFSLTHINEKANNAYFSKKISPKVLVVQKKAVPLHSLSGKRYC